MLLSVKVLLRTFSYQNNNRQHRSECQVNIQVKYGMGTEKGGNGRYRGPNIYTLYAIVTHHRCQQHLQ